MKNYRKPLADSELHYYDVEQAINDGKIHNSSRLG